MSFDERCQITKTDGVVAVFVNGAAWMTFDEDDVACQRLAMVQLAVQGIGTHEEIATAFELKPLSVDRLRKAFREHGLAGLLPKKKGPKGPRVTGGKIDQAILKARRAGQSKADIAAKLGISPPSVSVALRRLGYREPSAANPPGAQAAREENPKPVDDAIACPPESAHPTVGASDSSHLEEARDASSPIAIPPTAVPAAFTMDTDASNRSIDRALAVSGLLDDAAPLFGNAEGIRDVGALLAIPLMAQQGVFYEALKVFHAIGPAFYGLRTSIVFLCLMMVLNLSRLQDILQREPCSMGKLVGLDRSPELKTLRRKLRTLARQGLSLPWMEALDLLGRNS